MRNIIGKFKNIFRMTDGELVIIIVCLLIIIVFNILFSELISRETPEVQNDSKYTTCFIGCM
jgi:hypothetical protein